MKRFYVPTETEKLVALSSMVYGFPTMHYLHLMDSLAVFPGYIDRTVTEASSLFQHQTHFKRLYVNGVNPSVPLYQPLTEERLRSSPFRIPAHRPIVTQIYAEHTKDQTDWLADRLVESGDLTVAVVIYPVHLIRAFSTLVQSLNERNRLDILAFPISAEISPADEFPEFKINAWELMTGELRRIAKYRKEGGAARHDVMQEYLQRMWEYIQ